MDFADQFMECDVIGVDLSPIQPKWVPPNVQFQVDDIESAWTFNQPFDFIMGRYLMLALKDYKKVIDQAFENTTPSGYVEFQDLDMTLHSDDGTLPATSPTIKWNRQLAAAADKIRMEHSPGPELATWFRAAGFVNVTERVVKLPWGVWPKDPTLKEIGFYNLTQMENGLEAYSLRLFCDVLGWREDEVLTLLGNVRRQIRDPRIHGYYNWHVVYGQKPA